jgi:glyoxylase-like metal-dependent hydrolase (beta-lactamase superfamily II)
MNRFIAFLNCSSGGSVTDDTLAIPVLKQSLQHVLSLKEKGNDLFSKRQFSKAIKEYTKALDCFDLKPIGQENPSETEDAILCSLLFSNRAQAFIFTNQLEEALVDSNKTILIRPEWIKGYFRRAEAFFAMKDFSRALLDYELALSKEPNDEILQQKIQKTRVKIQEKEQNLIVYQLLSGRDTCKKAFVSPIKALVFRYAEQMQNFIYIIGDAISRECLVVDACWDVDSILSFAADKQLKIVGAIATHFHFDHVGGIPPPPFDSYNVKVDGLATLLKRLGIKAFVHANDIPEIIKSNPELSEDMFVATYDRFQVSLPIGKEPNTRLTFLHTPGHTTGSQCILLNNTSLFSGDTLFISSCGRIDFPESNGVDMFTTLSKKLKILDDSIGVYPGHAYNGEMTTIGIEKSKGVLRYKSYPEFMERN